MIADKQVVIRASRGKYPYQAGKHLLAMVELYAYADESGMHGSPSHLVLAGYIASPRQWDSFCREWRSWLSEFGISLFHSKNFFSSVARGHHKEFGNWSNKKAQEFIFGLTQIIHGHRIYPLGCGIDVQAFNDFTIGERRFLTCGIWNPRKGVFEANHNGKPSSPYFAAFQYFVRNALDRTPEKAKLHLVFDHQDQMESYAHNAFEAWGKIPRHKSDVEKLDSITYQVSTNTPQLQAADLYTYGWYNYIVHGISRNPILHLAMHELTLKDRGMGLFNAKGIEDNLQKALPPSERSRIREQM